MLNRRAAVGRDPSQGDEHGMTLVELMLAMTISLIILGFVGVFVTVFSGAETTTVASANAAADTRAVLLQLQHDIQAAKPPLATLSSTSDYNDMLILTDEPSKQTVTWKYTPATGQLTRQVDSGTPAVELTGITNGNPADGGIPIFTYYGRCHTNLVADASRSDAGPNVVAENVTVITVTLAVKHVSSAPYGTTTAVNIMNKQPGLSPCG